MKEENMKKELKKVAAIILTFFLCIGLLPANSLAAENEYNESPVEEVTSGAISEMQPDLSNETTEQTENYAVTSQTGQEPMENDAQTPENAMSGNVLNQEETDENNQVFEGLQNDNSQESYNDVADEASNQEHAGESSTPSDVDMSQALLSTTSDSAAVDVSKPADFIFVIDSTGSMRSYINSVRSNLSSFVQYLAEKDVNINLAVIDYKDITSDGSDSTVIHLMDGNQWSNNSNQIAEQLNMINTTGGGDNPETPTDAFAKILDGQISWSDDAQKFVFLLTDADFKDSDDDAQIRSMAECTEYFRANGIHTTIVGDLAYEDHYRSLYQLTGGKYIDINSADYYKLMIDIADWVYDETLDTDGDGLPDEWETNGVDIDHDGIIDLHLEEMGADPNVKDLFVEVDWMYQPYVEGSFLGITYTKQKEKNLKPSAEAMRSVYQQFKDHGINLHIDAGADSIDYVTGKTWGDLSGGNSIEYSSNFDLGSNYENWNQMALNNFDRARWSVFRYCLFVNKYNDGRSSGIAEGIPGQFFIIADVDGWISGTNTATAGTFMHELGHTLGLRHGGSDNVHYKPNYLSIMNYSFQVTGLVGTNEVNYSEYVLPSLNENSLNENNGIDPNSITAGSNIGTKWYYEKEHKFLFFDFGTTTESGTATGVAGQSIDFNANGTIENNVSVNLNASAETNLSESVNDWNRIIFKGGLIGGYGEDITEDTVLISYNPDMEDELNELDYDTALENGLLGNPGNCSITNVNPSRIYENLEDQKLYVSVNNLYSDTSTPTLKVTSDLLSESFVQKLELPGTLGKMESITIEIPVKSDLNSGSYKVVCELECDDGTTVSFTKDIVVEEAQKIQMTPGETQTILPDDAGNNDYNWSTSSDVVSIDENGNVTANGEGIAVITGTNPENEVISFIIESRSENASTDNSNQDENLSNPNVDDSQNIQDETDKNVIENGNENSQQSQNSSVNQITSTSQPETGDNTNITLYVVLCVLSLGCISGLVLVKKRKKKM